MGLFFPKPSLSATISHSNNLLLSWSYPQQYPTDYFILVWRNPYGVETTINVLPTARSYAFNGAIYGNHNFSIRAVRNGVGISEYSYTSVNLQQQTIGQWTVNMDEDTINATVPDSCARMDYDFVTGWGDVTIYVDWVQVAYIPVLSKGTGTVSVSPGQWVYAVSSGSVLYGNLSGGVTFIGQRPPGNLNVVSIGSSSVKLTWSPSPSPTDNYSIIWIRGNDWGEILVPSNATSHEITGLQNGDYYFGIASVKNGAYSNGVQWQRAMRIPALAVQDITYEYLIDGYQFYADIYVPAGYYTLKYYVSGDPDFYIAKDDFIKINLTYDYWNNAYVGSFQVTPWQFIYLESNGYNYTNVRITLTE